jgi:hypothetical protein
MAMPSQAPGEDEAAAFYEQRRTELLRDELVTEKRMFGTTALCAQGKVFMFPWRQNMVFKLPADRVAELIAAKSGELFDPGHGVPAPPGSLSTRAPMRPGQHLRTRRTTSCKAGGLATNLARLDHYVGIAASSRHGPSHTG